MRRLSIACLLGLAGTCAALSFAPVAALATVLPRAQLRGFVCQRATDPAGRAVAVTAVMRPVTGTARMALRFELDRRASRRGPFAAVSGRDLGRWIAPTEAGLGQRPGDVWRLVKQVVNLPAGLYRFRVAFRWSAADGHVIGRTERLSDTCFQPELRPDLRVDDVQIALSGSAGQDQYVAVIRNAGRSAAGPFDVALSIGNTVQTKAVSQLPARSKLRVTFQAAACTTGDPVTVTADPDLRIDDFNRANNAKTVTCPAASASASERRPAAAKLIAR